MLNRATTHIIILGLILVMTGSITAGPPVNLWQQGELWLAVELGTVNRMLPDENQIGKDKSDRIYFLKGRKFATGCTEIYYSPVFKIPTVLVFAPIVEEETKNLLGIGVMRISFERLSRIIIEECALLKDEEVYVLDRNGRFAFGSIAPMVSLGEKLHSKAIRNCLTSKTDIK